MQSGLEAKNTHPWRRGLGFKTGAGLLVIASGLAWLWWQNPREHHSTAARVNNEHKPGKAWRSGAAKPAQPPASAGESAADIASPNTIQVTGGPEPEAAVSEEKILQDLRGAAVRRKIKAAGQAVAHPTPALAGCLIAETAECADLPLRRKLLDQVRQLDAAACGGQLVGVLTSPRNGDLRNAAREALLKCSSPEVVRQLIQGAQQVAESDKLLRDMARTISKIQKAEAVEELFLGIGSELPEIQAGCVAALAGIGTEPAASALFSYYDSALEVKREIILEGFSRFRNAQAIPVLEQIAERTSDAKLKAAISQALKKMPGRS